MKAVELLADDDKHPGLHSKEVSGKMGAWSVRVSKDYRMVGYRDGETVTRFRIGTHTNYDKLLKRLGRGLSLPS